MELKNEVRDALFEFLLRLGDDRLILGHRLSEWCGHAHSLEEDIALTNVSLDFVGQASALLSLAGEVENKNRNEDDLAYFREAMEFKNVQLVEQPNIDFAYTMVRQFLFDSFNLLLNKNLVESKFEDLAGIAAKTIKESTYHNRHSNQWLLRLGDGTEESHNRTQKAIDDLWIFTADLFYEDEIDELLISEGISFSTKAIKDEWENKTKEIIEKATLTTPETKLFDRGSRKGIHTEHLGHLLAEMQIVPRSFPDAKW